METRRTRKKADHDDVTILIPSESESTSSIGYLPVKRRRTEKKRNKKERKGRYPGTRKNSLRPLKKSSSNMKSERQLSSSGTLLDTRDRKQQSSDKNEQTSPTNEKEVQNDDGDSSFICDRDLNEIVRSLVEEGNDSSINPKSKSVDEDSSGKISVRKTHDRSSPDYCDSAIRSKKTKSLTANLGVTSLRNRTRRYHSGSSTDSSYASKKAKNTKQSLQANPTRNKSKKNNRDNSEDNDNGILIESLKPTDSEKTSKMTQETNRSVKNLNSVSHDSNNLHIDSSKSESDRLALKGISKERVRRNLMKFLNDNNDSAVDSDHSATPGNKASRGITKRNRAVRNHNGVPSVDSPKSRGSRKASGIQKRTNLDGSSDDDSDSVTESPDSRNSKRDLSIASKRSKEQKTVDSSVGDGCSIHSDNNSEKAKSIKVDLGVMSTGNVTVKNLDSVSDENSLIDVPKSKEGRKASEAISKHTQGRVRKNPISSSNDDSNPDVGSDDSVVACNKVSETSTKRYRTLRNRISSVDNNSFVDSRKSKGSPKVPQVLLRSRKGRERYVYYDGSSDDSENVTESPKFRACRRKVSITSRRNGQLKNLDGSSDDSEKLSDSPKSKAGGRETTKRNQQLKNLDVSSDDSEKISDSPKSRAGGRETTKRNQQLKALDVSSDDSEKLSDSPKSRAGGREVTKRNRQLKDLDGLLAASNDFAINLGKAQGIKKCSVVISTKDRVARNFSRTSVKDSDSDIDLQIVKGRKKSSGAILKQRKKRRFNHSSSNNSDSVSELDDSVTDSEVTSGGLPKRNRAQRNLHVVSNNENHPLIESSELKDSRKSPRLLSVKYRSRKNRGSANDSNNAAFNSAKSKGKRTSSSIIPSRRKSMRNRGPSVVYIDLDTESDNTHAGSDSYFKRDRDLECLPRKVFRRNRPKPENVSKYPVRPKSNRKYLHVDDSDSSSTVSKRSNDEPQPALVQNEASTRERTRIKTQSVKHSLLTVNNSNAVSHNGISPIDSPELKSSRTSPRLLLVKYRSRENPGSLNESDNAVFNLAKSKDKGTTGSIIPDRNRPRRNLGQSVVNLDSYVESDSTSADSDSDFEPDRDLKCRLRKGLRRNKQEPENVRKYPLRPKSNPKYLYVDDSDSSSTVNKKSTDEPQPLLVQNAKCIRAKATKSKTQSEKHSLSSNLTNEQLVYDSDQDGSNHSYTSCEIETAASRHKVLNKNIGNLQGKKSVIRKTINSTGQSSSILRNSRSAHDSDNEHNPICSSECGVETVAKSIKTKNKKLQDFVSKHNISLQGEKSTRLKTNSGGLKNGQSVHNFDSDEYGSYCSSGNETGLLVDNSDNEMDNTVKSCKVLKEQLHISLSDRKSEELRRKQSSGMESKLSSDLIVSNLIIRVHKLLHVLNFNPVVALKDAKSTWKVIS